MNANVQKCEVNKNGNADYCDSVLRWLINIKVKN